MGRTALRRRKGSEKPWGAGAWARSPCPCRRHRWPHLFPNVGRTPPVERNAARKHLPQHHAKGIHIHGLGKGVVPQQLWGHVVGRARGGGPGGHQPKVAQLYLCV
jgi:hypothetical protein